MGRKRKASSTAFTTSNSHSTKRKRNNKFPSSDTDKEPVQIGDEEYPINCILDETRTKYLIDWEGPYSPTWVGYNVKDSLHLLFHWRLRQTS